MKLWKSNLVDKIIRNKVDTGLGKQYLPCPFCGEVLNTHMNIQTGDIFKEPLSFTFEPAVRMGAFVYIKPENMYGESCHCTVCNKRFYACDSKDSPDLVYKDMSLLSYEDVLIERKVDGQLTFINKTIL